MRQAGMGVDTWGYETSVANIIWWVNACKMGNSKVYNVAGGLLSPNLTCNANQSAHNV